MIDATPISQAFGLNADLGVFFVRAAVAAIFLGHAWNKLTHPAEKAKILKWSPVSVIVLGLFETLAALGYLAGSHMKLSALVLSVIGIGALWMHVMRFKTPFLSTSKKKGFELDILLLACNLMILLSGGGALTFMNSFLFSM